MDEAKHTNAEAYKLLLDNGGKARAKGDIDTVSLLDYHAMKGNFEIVKILVDYGARITKNTFYDCKDDRSLYYLIDHAGDFLLEDSLEILINQDTRPSGFIYYFRNHSIKDYFPSYLLKCLSRAFQVKNESVCIFILKNIEISDKINLKDFPEDTEHWLINAVDMNIPECLRLLLEIMEKSHLIEGYFKPKPKSRVCFYRAIELPDYYLHAAKLNNIEIIKILIEYKVPINHEFDDYYNNALFWSAIHCNSEIIHLLLEYGYEKLDLREDDIGTFHIHPDFVKLISK